MSNDKLKDGRKHGFYIIDNDIIDKYGEAIGVYGVAIYNLIARYASGKNEGAFPSYQTIADKLGISRPKAVTTINQLVELGLIKKEKRIDSAGDMTSNVYTLVDLGGGKPDLLPSKQDLPPSYPDLLQVVNDVNQGSKPDLPYQYKDNNTKTKKNSASRQSSKTTDEVLQKTEELDPQKELVKQILAAYVEVRGKNGINYGKEGAWAKRIAKEHPENTTEWVKACYQWLKQDKFYEFKPVPLAKVYENLPEFIRYLESRNATIGSNGEPARQKKTIKIYNQYTGQHEERTVA